MTNFMAWQSFVLVWVAFILSILARLSILREWEDFIMGAVAAIFVIAFVTFGLVGFVNG